MKVGDMVHINITGSGDKIGLLVNIRHYGCLADNARYEVIWKGKLISLPQYDVIKYEGNQ